MRGPMQIVIAFRGTASLANIRADLRVWRTRYPADVGSPLLFTAPMVHEGFHAAWTANGFNRRLLGRLQHIVGLCTEGKDSDKPIDVYVTGWVRCAALCCLERRQCRLGGRPGCGGFCVDLALPSFAPYMCLPVYLPVGLPDAPLAGWRCRHSLGGALATLCAFDIKRSCPRAGEEGGGGRGCAGGRCSSQAHPPLHVHPQHI